ncbi:MAG: TIGR03767 family metallophosphoesterase [Aquihabitans sp.]
MPNHQANSLSDVTDRLLRIARVRWAGRRNGPVPGGLVTDPGPLPGGSGSEAAPLTTVEATIRPMGNGRYRRLGWAPGEAHLLRTDLGVTPSASRAKTRRSVVYVAHHTDAHVCDVQAPARLEGGETFGWVNPGSDGGHRPQETCTTQVLDQMVIATNAVVKSPVTGASMAWCIQTGDNTDNRTRAEVTWWLDVLDGRRTTANTGTPGRYDGVQRSGWKGVWNPDDPSRDLYGRAGFPKLAGFLDAAVAPFDPAGLAVPWLAVFGNHDALFQGTFGIGRPPHIERLGPMLAGTVAKPTGTIGLVRAIIHATLFGPDMHRWERWTQRVPIGVRRVAGDADARRWLDVDEYLGALLGADSAAQAGHREPGQVSGPGPIGHGFSAQNRSESTTWWSRPEGDHVQVLGLDTCNHTHGDGGGLGPRQTAWLEQELVSHHRRWQDRVGQWHEGGNNNRLVVITSHHNSWTMDNPHHDDADPGPRLLGPDFVALLHRFPNVVLWANGHCHEHRVIPHPGVRPGAGWWEVNTASLIDFSQQARTYEVVDNRDGTLSILVTVLDHAAPPLVPYDRTTRWTTADLASISRELAANDNRWIDPIALLGSPGDRNVELVLRAPFELGVQRV